MSADLLELGIAYRVHGPAEQRVRCPRCDRGERDDALGVNTETGVYHCFRCGWSGKATTGETRSASIMRLDDPDRAERVRQRLRATWRESVALSALEPAATVVRTYLASRCLEKILASLPARIRAHPALPYFDTLTRRELGRFPAMIALLTDGNDKPVSLHATYLRADGRGKAPVASPKKILGVPVRGATKGGAIRLYAQTTGRLGVAEGIENALSLTVLQKVSSWSAFCADNLAAIRLPAQLTELLIGVDLDANGAGQRAAQALLERMKRERPQLQVKLILPRGGAGDLNDELRGSAK